MKRSSISAFGILLAASLFVVAGCEKADDPSAAGTTDTTASTDATTSGSEDELGDASGASVFDDLGSTDDEPVVSVEVTTSDDSGSGTGGGIETPIGLGDDSGSGTGGGVETP